MAGKLDVKEEKEVSSHYIKGAMQSVSLVHQMNGST
jgi:hypothetical protein